MGDGRGNECGECRGWKKWWEKESAGEDGREVV